MGGAPARPVHSFEGTERRRNLRSRPQSPAGAGAVSSMVIHVKFDTGAARVWQVIDPQTESVLDQGESSDSEVRVTLPEGDGAYRVQVNDRGRFTFVDAQVSD